MSQHVCEKKEKLFKKWYSSCCTRLDSLHNWSQKYSTYLCFFSLKGIGHCDTNSRSCFFKFPLFFVLWLNHAFQVTLQVFFSHFFQQVKDVLWKCCNFPKIAIGVLGLLALHVYLCKTKFLHLMVLCVPLRR